MFRKGIFSEKDDVNEGSGFINNDYQTQDGRDKFGSYFHGQQNDRFADPFVEFRSVNPFKIMREFERIFDEDVAYQQTGPGSFVSTGRNDDDFMKEFFGIRDFIHDPRYHQARFGVPGDDSFFSHHIDHPNMHRHQNNFSNFSNNPEGTPSRPQQQAPAQVFTDYSSISNSIVIGTRNPKNCCS